MTNNKTRFIEDFMPEEITAIERQYAAKVVPVPGIGWFNRHFVEEQNIYYCKYCGWPTKITGSIRNFARGFQKAFLNEARKHLGANHGMHGALLPLLRKY